MLSCKIETVLESSLMLPIRFLLDKHSLNQFIDRRKCLVGSAELGPKDKKTSKKQAATDPMIGLSSRVLDEIWIGHIR